jgi:hypothetical protein
MKFYAFLIILFYLVHSLSNIKKQSIHLSPNKLLITDNKNDSPIIKQSIPTEIENKNVFDINFPLGLKDAEKTLYNKLNKKKASDDNSTNDKINIIPTYKIVSLNTTLDIRPSKTFGEVNEIVKFQLENGSFSSISRKISLSGSSDSLIAFKVSSSDVKLKEARILNNCLEETNTWVIPKPYICVISIFEEIDAKINPKIVEIEYEYIAQDIIRLKDDINKIVWYYDNNKKMTEINNISTSLIIRNRITMKDAVYYPDKNYKLDVKNNDTFISWTIGKLKENEYQKIWLEFPIVDSNIKYRKFVNKINIERYKDGNDILFNVTFFFMVYYYHHILIYDSLYLYQ